MKYLILILAAACTVWAEVQEWVTCEGDTMNLSCKKGWELRIEDAYYGRLDDTTCVAEGQMRDLDCGDYEIEAVNERCKGRHACSINVGEDLFGDPCPYTYKYLRVAYECLPQEEVPAKVSEKSKKAAWTEWTPCTVTCGGGVRTRSIDCNPKEDEHCTDYRKVEVKRCNVKLCIRPATWSFPQLTNGRWGRWSGWSGCFGDCGSAVRTAWRSCLHKKEMVGFLHCAGQPFKTKPCVRKDCTTTAVITTQKPETTTKPEKFAKVNVNGTGKNIELDFEEIGGDNAHKNQAKDNLHIHCNVHCTSAKDCAKMRARCKKRGKGEAQVQLAGSGIQIRTFPGKKGGGSSTTVVGKASSPKLLHKGPTVTNNSESSIQTIGEEMKDVKLDESSIGKTATAEERTNSESSTQTVGEEMEDAELDESSSEDEDEDEETATPEEGTNVVRKRRSLGYDGPRKPESKPNGTALKISRRKPKNKPQRQQMRKVNKQNAKLNAAPPNRGKPQSKKVSKTQNEKTGNSKNRKSRKKRKASVVEEGSSFQAKKPTLIAEGFGIAAESMPPLISNNQVRADNAKAEREAQTEGKNVSDSDNPMVRPDQYVPVKDSAFGEVKKASESTVAQLQGELDNSSKVGTGKSGDGGVEVIKEDASDNLDSRSPRSKRDDARAQQLAEQQAPSNNETETESPSEGQYTAWADWSKCSNTCGVGFQKRMRQCRVTGTCSGHIKQLRACVGQNKVCTEDIYRRNLMERDVYKLELHSFYTNKTYTLGIAILMVMLGALVVSIGWYCRCADRRRHELIKYRFSDESLDARRVP